MHISIAMATYNGAPYLEAQLDSLARQALRPLELVVCDDGSSDETVPLLQSFAKTAPFPVHIYENATNLGFADNFFKAARRCRGDWVAFCDQDDIWLPGKLAQAAGAIETNPALCLVLQNAEICDAELNVLAGGVPESIRPGVYGQMEQNAFWVWPGFLQTFKRALVDEIDTVNRPAGHKPGFLVQPHDRWLCMIANALGGICVLPGATVRYRRHAATVTGTHPPLTIRERIRRSRSLQADHYRLLVDSASASSDYFRRIARETNRAAWRVAFEQSANSFERVAAIERLRGTIGEANSFWRRVCTLTRIWRMGGYLGAPFLADGWTSVFKDMVRMVRWP